VENKECVSVIVPAYNAEDYLTRCLESLISQTHSNVEIIVVYKKSTDNTEVLLNRYKDRVRIIEQKGKSPANARNLGITQCKGEYVAFCDADDVFRVDKIERQVKCLKSFRDVGAVYSDFFLINSEDRVIDRVITPDWNFHRWLTSRYIAFSTLMVRKDLLFQVNLFDEKLASNEDSDLLMKLAHIAQFRRLPACLSCRRIHKHNLGKSLFKTLLSSSRVSLRYGYTSLAIYSFFRGLIFSLIFYFLVGHPKLYSLAKRVAVRLYSLLYPNKTFTH
jgi:glycosyltransferase involved in cell wall biosynthesis